jgi:hypothetical protein
MSDQVGRERPLQRILDTDEQPERIALEVLQRQPETEGLDRELMPHISEPEVPDSDEIERDELAWLTTCVGLATPHDPCSQCVYRHLILAALQAHTGRASTSEIVAFIADIRPDSKTSSIWTVLLDAGFLKGKRQTPWRRCRPDRAAVQVDTDPNLAEDCWELVPRGERNEALVLEEPEEPEEPAVVRHSLRESKLDASTRSINACLREVNSSLSQWKKQQSPNSTRSLVIKQACDTTAEDRRTAKSLLSKQFVKSKDSTGRTNGLHREIDGWVDRCSTIHTM